MSSQTHRAIATTAPGILEEIQVPTNSPGLGQILVKVAFAGLGPADSYILHWRNFLGIWPVVVSFTLAGTVASVGAGVTDLHIGDKVAAMSLSSAGRGAQEYALLSRNDAAEVPADYPLELASTIPDNYVTAYWLLFGCLKLPLPTVFPASEVPAESETPILVYGAGSSSAQYIIQLMKLAGYKRIIATASPRHHDFVRKLGATEVFDYKSPTLSSDIVKAANGPLKYVADPIANKQSFAVFKDVVAPGSKIAMLSPFKDGDLVMNPQGTEMNVAVPDNIKQQFSGVEIIEVGTTMAYLDPQNAKAFENVMPTLSRLLETKLLEPNRVRLLKEGSLKDRVAEGLELLRDNKISGEKVVVQI